jgi:hypothetical protein
VLTIYREIAVAKPPPPRVHKSILRHTKLLEAAYRAVGQHEQAAITRSLYTAALATLPAGRGAPPLTVRAWLIEQVVHVWTELGGPPATSKGGPLVKFIMAAIAPVATITEPAAAEAARILRHTSPQLPPEAVPIVANHTAALQLPPKKYTD